jgi:type II secretory pathway predicted ATPase ExeA
MYRDFYHLEYVPFTATPDSDLANLSRRHQVVFEQVVEGLNKQQGLLVLLGEAGLGKVALLRSALAKNSDTKRKTILIDIRKIHFQNQIYFSDIVKAVYHEIGYEIKYQTSLDALIDLHDIFIEERKKDSSFIIIINHAHLLPYEVLKSIPKLIDVYPYRQPLAQLVLAGEPALDKYLRDSTLQQLKKRIQLVAKLDTLNRKESIAYIQRKLSKASSRGASKVFSNAAIHKIVKAADGIPRNLNILCTDVLDAGCKWRKRPIPASLVKQVLDDFQVRRSRWVSRSVWLGVAAVVLTTLAAKVIFKDSVANHWQMVMQWPHQVLEQMPSLFADPTQRTEALPPQAPQQVGVPPAPQSTPAAIPADRPLPDVGMPPSLPRTSPKPSPPNVIVKTPLQPRAIQQVADLIDQGFPKGGAFGLKVWSDKAPGEAYVKGENLIIYVMADTPAFLRIDYYQADGKIVHLLPRPLINNRVQAGQRFTLGGNGNAFQFKVAPPFGMEMLTVVASQRPIDMKSGMETDTLNAPYVARLSRQLQTYGTQGKVAAAYVRIQTRP